MRRNLKIRAGEGGGVDQISTRSDRPRSRKFQIFGVSKPDFFRGAFGAALFPLQKSIFLGCQNPVFPAAPSAPRVFATLWRHPTKTNKGANEIKLQLEVEMKIQIRVQIEIPNANSNGNWNGYRTRNGIDVGLGLEVQMTPDQK